MDARFELFDHTADVGLRVFAPTLEGLIAPATAGLYSTIGDIAACGPAETLILDLPGKETATLFRDYLAELLRLFESSQRLFTAPSVTEFTDSHLRVSGQLMRVDTDATLYDREVKAITYHELSIRQTPDGFVATVILDI